MEATMEGQGFRDMTPIMENQMEKQTCNGMEAGYKGVATVCNICQK